MHSDGSRSNCWAVQRANFEVDIDREYRFDIVAAELETFRRNSGVEASAHVSPVTKLVRLTPSEWAQAILLVPATAGVGMLINWI